MLGRATRNVYESYQIVFCKELLKIFQKISGWVDFCGKNYDQETTLKVESWVTTKVCSSAERWTRRKRKQQNPLQTLKGVGKDVGRQILDQNIYISVFKCIFCRTKRLITEVFCCHNRMIEDKKTVWPWWTSPLQDKLQSSVYPVTSPPRLRRESGSLAASNRLSWWFWDENVFFKYWNDMTWISYIDVHHICFVLVIWLVCRIQRTLLLKSNALALSKWAACPAKVISSQRWHRRVASDCSWQFRGTSNSNCYWLASSRISTFSIYLTINT